MGYTIKTATFNAGNNNLDATAVGNIVAALGVVDVADADKPDVICFSFQEAQNSWGGQNLGERVAKRIEGYTLVYNNSFRAMTKPGFPNKVGTAVLVKNDKLDEIAVIEGRSGSIRGVNGFGDINKGGQAIKLRMGDKHVGILSGHLSSHTRAQRQETVKQMKAHFKEKEVDGMILMGDLNERLSDREDVSALENDLNGQDAPRLIAQYDPLTSGDGVFGDFLFAQASEFTYEKRNKQGEIKRSNDPDCPYKVGVLDNIGISGDHWKNADDDNNLQVHKIENKDTEDASDHKMASRSLSFDSALAADDKQRIKNKIECRALNGQFKLGLFGSRYKISIEGRDYEVPRRVVTAP
ncbi:endonuclease/exonuclease/phosphatase family protein [Facilibium subflavum]|uniref:endonuclease/exonuclease/phosphatase family protein n=1 Tax=Facilibium subflavum TaxID=2219058 RepID=UPI000E650D99|nr:endonuclease/exonuclease/phosphatase family protein [Facilibium subflavum]